MTIASDIQKFDVGSIVTLYELDATVQGGSLVRFHDGSNEKKAAIIWDGDNYTAFPIQVSGYEKTTGGVLARPTIRIANVSGIVAALIAGTDDLIGAKLTRIRTFEAYLDAANFISGSNATADPTIKFVDDIYYISQKTIQNKNVIEFEITASFDVISKALPGRIAIQNVCTWLYKGAECGYSGSNYWNVNDQTEALTGDDVCGKRLQSCKLGFGETAELPFGGFPGLGLQR